MGIELKHAGGPKWQAVDGDGVVLEEWQGKRRDVEPQFNEWLSKQEIEEPASEVVEDATPEAVKKELPDPSKLTGRAKTAALNAQQDTVFVEGEWRSASGVNNEANRVYNVPEGYQVAWATPRNVDGGRHANFLRERGYRPVYRDEMGDDMYGDELYVAFLDEADSEFAFMSGAQLFIGPSDRLAKIRQAEYDAHMAAFNSKQEEDREFAEDRLGGELRTNRESSVYNPMRS